jgi:hypothetical protein
MQGAMPMNKARSVEVEPRPSGRAEDMVKNPSRYFARAAKRAREQAEREVRRRTESIERKVS